MVSKASLVTSSPTSKNQLHSISVGIPQEYNSDDFKIVAYLVENTDFYEIDSVLVN